MFQRELKNEWRFASKSDSHLFNVDYKCRRGRLTYRNPRLSQMKNKKAPCLRRSGTLRAEQGRATRHVVAPHSSQSTIEYE